MLQHTDVSNQPMQMSDALCIRLKNINAMEEESIALIVQEDILNFRKKRRFVYCMW
jgi:hypothetical protein